VREVAKIDLPLIFESLAGLNAQANLPLRGERDPVCRTEIVEVLLDHRYDLACLGILFARIDGRTRSAREPVHRQDMLERAGLEVQMNGQLAIAAPFGT
jgi:hypothetical protein